MRACSLVATVVVLLSASLAALGQGPTPERVREMLTQMDSNKDGRIERSEVPEAQRARFAQMLEFADANSNGTLDPNEIETIVARARNQTKAQPKAAAVQQARQALARMDRNGDGKVSRDEFTSHADYFDRIDANKDGALVPDEIGPGTMQLLNRNLPYLPPPRDSTGLVPLTDLKSAQYKGKEGGLYAGGSNERPARHEEAGLRLARAIEPLDAEGRASADGKVVLLSIGMSNTTMEFSAFKTMADADPAKNPKLAIIDGAQGGMTARVISQPESPNGKRYWDTVDQRLKAAGLTRAQVQVAWIKQADAMPTATTFPEYAVTLEDEHLKIVQLLKGRFPNLKMAYLSSRIYGGYATTPLNPEPYAYEGGFSVKWLIAKQIDGDAALNFDPDRGPVKSPWLSWGPYLWADGAKARGDGLTYVPADFAADGTHPANSARRIVAQQLLSFFKSDSTARPWFIAGRR